MQFRFFSLSDEAGLDLVGEIDVTGVFSDVKGAVEQHFENVVSTFAVRQVIVLCTSLGDPPGRIVAAETVYVAHLSGKVKPPQQSRSLIWLVEESVPKH
ncbi:MAG: hypothetical protein WD894_00410 [Pirellulales bacterium]